MAGYQFLDVNTKFQLASATGPLIRTLDAETAHRVGILAARYGLFPKETRPDPESLKVQLWGRTFPNPIGEPTPARQSTAQDLGSVLVCGVCDAAGMLGLQPCM